MKVLEEKVSNRLFSFHIVKWQKKSNWSWKYLMISSIYFFPIHFLKRSWQLSMKYDRKLVMPYINWFDTFFYQSYCETEGAGKSLNMDPSRRKNHKNEILIACLTWQNVFTDDLWCVLLFVLLFLVVIVARRKILWHTILSSARN